MTVSDRIESSPNFESKQQIRKIGISQRPDATQNIIIYHDYQ